MTEYNVTIELAKRKPSLDDVDTLVDAFAEFHPTIGTSTLGWVEVTLTVQAESLRQAVAIGVALGGDVISVTAMTTAEFDRRANLPVRPANAPTLASVTEAAEHFGISRAAVQKRIDAGKLPAEKVGDTWVILGLPED